MGAKKSKLIVCQQTSAGCIYIGSVIKLVVRVGSVAKQVEGELLTAVIAFFRMALP